MDEPQVPDAHKRTARLRLFVTCSLVAGGNITLDRKQTHYLHSVMRAVIGDRVALFNGHEGEWRARVEKLGRSKTILAVELQLRPQTAEPSLWLAFAAIKRRPMDIIAQKATELGAVRLLPVFTGHSQATRVNTKRLTLIATEAAEQCSRLSVPEVEEVVSFDVLLAGWPGDDRPLLVCDETGRAPPLAEVLTRVESDKWGVLVGPEGGFSPAELDVIGQLPFATRVALGPRILRTETAVVAALSVVQALWGDWRPAVR